MDLDGLQARLDEFLTARDWHRHHTPKNLVMALTGEVGELVEIFQWMTPDQAATAMGDEGLRSRIEDEIADVLIYLVSLAMSLDVDLVDAAERKMDRNEHRFPVGSQPGTSR